MSADPVPVACTLTTAAAARQALEWSDLQHRATSIIAIEGGARLRLPAELGPHVRDLVARESRCCAFLTITTETTRREIVLDVTSGQPEARPVIELLAGIPIH